MNLFFRIMATAAMLSGALLAKATLPLKPDFAHPRQVIADAAGVLESGSGLERIQALMQIIEAENRIDPDSAFTAPAKVERLARTETAPDLRGLLLLYHARLLADIYTDSRYTYDKVDAPLDPVPANVAEWSGAQFRRAIAALADSATSVIGSVSEAPLREYRPVIEYNDLSLRFYPRLRDFAYTSAHDMLTRCGMDTQADSVMRVAYSTSKAGSLPHAVAACEYLGSKDLAELYRQHSQGEYGAYILCHLEDGTDNYEYIGMLKEYLAANPANPLSWRLTQRLATLTAPRADFDIPRTACPGGQLRAVVRHDFTKSVGLNIYRVTNPQATYERDYRLQPAGSVEAVTDASAHSVTDTLTLSFDRPGLYRIKPVIDGKENRSRWPSSEVYVTPYIPVLVNRDGVFTLILTDYTTGRPVEGARVWVRGRNRAASSRISMGYTDRDGVLGLKLPEIPKGSSQSYSLSVTKDGVDYHYPSDISAYVYRDEGHHEHIGANIYTDRPLYHPGDSLAWSVIATTTNNERTVRLLESKKLSVILYDANYQPVDTAMVTTDSYGRASGCFEIPAERLTGYYSISVEADGMARATSGVMVSEFKAPVFEITDTRAETGRPAPGEVTVTGRAATYSGMPVAGASVRVTVNRRIMWFRSSGETTGTVTGTTDEDGTFSIEIPADMLSGGNDYICRIDATSPSGDNASADYTFTTGKPVRLYYTGDSDMFETSDKVTLPVKAVTSSGRPVPTLVDWVLRADNGTMLSGRATTDSTGITANLAGAPAGRYSLSVVPADTAACDSLGDIRHIWLYNIAEGAVPADKPLFVPCTSITVSNPDEAVITVGVPDDSRIYVVSPGEGKNCIVKPYDLSRGFHGIRPQFVAENFRADIMLLTVHRGEVTVSRVNISIFNPDELVLTAESWRDHLVPGAQENWIFSLRTAGGSAATGAMIATMYNHALDALQPYQWAGIDFARYSPIGYSAMSSEPGSFHYSLGTRKGTSAGQWPDAPSFRYISTTIRIRGYNMMYARSATGGVAMKSAATYNAVESVEEEAVAADVGDALFDLSEEKVSGQPSDNETLREGQTMQAFWMPDLAIGTDGTVTLRFNVPEDNATWSFHALAWNKALKSASMARNVVANRPIMVQPSLPRFLREGDTAILQTTVFNNASDTDTVRTVVELFDPFEGTVIATEHKTVVIEPGRSAIVGIRAHAAVGTSLLGYRIKAAGSRFADGQQDAIPVLSSGAVVIESDNFVLTDSRPEYTAKLPSDTASVMALQYCQNPVWDVVRSLPALLRTSKNMSCTEAAYAAYGALTARGLLKNYPQIKEVIDLWEAEPGQAALVSDLLKDEDIKIALLGQTPWVQAAASETDRMGRLAATFDGKSIKSTLDKAVAALAKLQQPDGGFAWGSWRAESSLWSTMSVLSTLGRLNAVGYMPANGRLNDIISRALGYCDRNVDSDDMTYAYVLSLYPSHRPSTLKARQITDKAVSEITAGWRKASTAAKARYALILLSAGHKATAREIMSSVREFGVTDNDGGMSFPSVSSADEYAVLLEAFAKIAPVRSDLDAIRRSLMLRSRVTDDMGACNPSALITAILATGTDWTTLDDGTADITIGRNPLVSGRIEAASGEFSVRLAPGDAGKKLTVRRNIAGPVSYGSLTTVSTRPMTAVAARPCSSLSVEKRMLVNRDGQWAVTDSVRLGERVRVQLLVNAAEDLQYVTVSDERAAALEPVDQMPGYVYAAGLGFYRENGDSRTRLFISWLPKGTYYLTYDMTASTAGSFASGIATVQSQYAPEVTAHSGGTTLLVD